MDEPSSSGTPPSTSTDAAMALPAGCLMHKVSKLDTLAGLAIKHKVSVADIKRANGLLSDNALFARDYVIIPTKPLPVGENVQSMVAQLLAGVGRDPTLDADANSHPASAAVARIARRFNVVNGKSYPEDVECPWLCQTCTGSEMFGDGDEARAAMSRLRRGSESSCGELELADMTPDRVLVSDTMFIPPATAGTTRMAEAVRRRRNGANDSPPNEEDEASAAAWHAEYDKGDKSFNRVSAAGGGHPHGHAQNGRHPPRADESSAIREFFTWKHISKTIGEGVQKLQQIANTPALASGPGTSSSFADAADGVLSGRGLGGGGGVVGGGSLLQQRNGSGTPHMSRPQSSASLLASRYKDGGKQE